MTFNFQTRAKLFLCSVWREKLFIVLLMGISPSLSFIWAKRRLIELAFSCRIYLKSNLTEERPINIVKFDPPIIRLLAVGPASSSQINHFLLLDWLCLIIIKHFHSALLFINLNRLRLDGNNFYLLAIRSLNRNGRKMVRSFVNEIHTWIGRFLPARFV